jgi:hypothetical protein
MTGKFSPVVARLTLLFGVSSVLFLIWYVLGPPRPTAPKYRPYGVPPDAVWVGGADGGAYVKCGIDRVVNVNRCEVWNESTGQLAEAGEYILRGHARAATEDELRTISFPDFGGHIYLSNSMVLDRIRSAASGTMNAVPR